ncbi:MAG: hypothetical protein ACI9N9_000052 [Enterobacterales bacterium]|jgi:hypothetical protein
MNDQEKNRVIEFYEDVVKTDDTMPTSDLTDEDLKVLRSTFWFARWELANHYDDCVKSIKAVISKF